MIVRCPNCNEPVEQVSAPKRGPSMDASEMWLCLKCPATVCAWCYHVHTAREHPEAYRERPTVDGQKKRKKK